MVDHIAIHNITIHNLIKGSWEAILPSYGVAALRRNASMRTPFDQIDICIAGMTDLCAPEFDDRFDARLPVREAAKHLVRASSNARTGLAGARRMQVL